MRWSEGDYAEECICGEINARHCPEHNEPISREEEWQAAGELERRVISLEEQVAYILSPKFLREITAALSAVYPAKVHRKMKKDSAALTEESDQ